MPNVFFIGDTHFGHAKLLTFENASRGQCFSCIEEHDEHLVERWNAVVRSKDVVYHLGDVSFGNLDAVKRLKGDKKLILGNHDKFSVVAPYFSNFYGALAYRKRWLLTHVPVNPGQLEFRFERNIHGHLHDAKIDDERYVNVACEQVNYTPVALEELISRNTT